MEQQHFASILDVLAQIVRTTSISFATMAPHTLPAMRSNPRKPAIFYNPYPEFFTQNQRLAAFGQSFLLTQEQKTKQEITHFQILMQKPA